ncbi:threonine/serine dehydratase [Lachnospiraceae bacterium NSJ-143]|nr:threonine/serine dehydratase [Lachnospiraceae bacterium NSJ-143]
MGKTTVTLNDIREAAERIRPYIRRTPLLHEETMDKILGCEVYLKPEMLQVTGAFKMRGAINKIFSLTEEERKKGIICSSSGNHGKACALAGKMTGTRIIVVLPDDCPTAKIEGIKKLGGEVILGPRVYKPRWEMVRQEVEKHGYTVVHGYEDYGVMAGQGTLTLEILQDLPETDTIVVPVGGGGLIAGVATAAKEINPRIKVVGVQAKASDGYVKSREAGQRVEVECFPSLADGLGCRAPGENPYPIIEKYVDEFVAVEEDDIAKAVKLVAEEAKLVAEPSSCVGIAAVLGGQLKVKPDERVCFILTSGNWDIDLIGKILKGEHVDGRV